MQATTSSQPSIGSRSSGVRICVIIIGYLIALSSALATFSIPIAISLLTMIAGFLAVASVSRGVYAAPRVTWLVGLVWLAGSVLILGVLGLIGEDRVRHWRPHPAGYQVAWWICVSAFRHLRQIIHHASAPTDAA